jgi:hypothetical protein
MRSVFWRFLALGVLLLGTTTGNPADAAVIYDFSLPANGAVGPVTIQLGFPAAVPAGGGLGVFPLTGPQVVSFTSGTPIDPAASAVGFEVLSTSTLIGIALRNSADSSFVLSTISFPNDFFVFPRTPLQEGTFSSTSGTVFSDLSLVTSTPTGQLMVSETVPEPAAVVMLSLGLAAGAGLVWRHRLAVGPPAPKW